MFQLATLAALSSCLAATTPDDTPPEIEDPSNAVIVKVDETGKIVFIQGDTTRIRASSIELQDAATGSGARIGTTLDGRLVLSPATTTQSTKRIGVTLEPVPPVLASHLDVDPEHVIMIADVAEGESAATAGLRRYDVVTAINGVAPVTNEGLRTAIVGCDEGQTVTLSVMRGDTIASIPVPVRTVSSTQHAGRLAVTDAKSTGEVLGLTWQSGEPVLVQTGPGQYRTYSESADPVGTLLEIGGELALVTSEPRSSREATRAAVLAELEAIHARLKNIERMLDRLRDS